MGFLKVDNVKISGIVSAVPEKVVKNMDLDLFANQQEAEKFISITGIEEKRHANIDVCTSDLCFHAAEELISKLNWNKEEIDILILVTQTPDYVVPNTSIILQDRLGLPKTCICFDVPLGCSGYVYGLSIISQFLQNGSFNKGILLVGDTLSKQCSSLDKSTYPLFGDAGCATALEFNRGSEMRFNLWSDGSGYNSIIVPDGGYRNPLAEKSLLQEADSSGNVRSKINTYMNGTEVFSFGISEVPKEIKKFMTHFDINVADVDFAIFHQANKFMNEMIRKKIGLSKEQVPYSLHKFGNTSSATIPLTISTLDDSVKNRNILMCGFGVGLSIGIVQTQIEEDFINVLLEV
ncbi:ketoacyl-ACP synthase III [Flavobacterium xinjiangense]|jgi:3-oxoacyl-[acyl-carrier-protein] synthase-3|uniref:3-oxoacyl-[acyl-carrier-protein] synthase-3 n=1 Tax=Flavobacterium xinjiangense TaxID=178356 RepID=A0A1M7MSW3_9FLAO|nr:ketoacyl-ACP synthase III [Flavobacterium xinjiangense]SHM94191.1 3-oxoacyl-[acyl-carrier-protein] synthase-3 [Flavobacterium xinjiangense]